MIGWRELLIVLVIVLVVFGAKKLRGVGSDLGEAVKGFKKGMQDEDGKDKPAPRLPDANRTDEAAQRERERDNDQQPR